MVAVHVDNLRVSVRDQDDMVWLPANQHDIVHGLAGPFARQERDRVVDSKRILVGA